MAIRIDWKNVENLSYILFSFGFAGLVQFGIILFAYYFLPLITPFILILVPFGTTILNCGSAILLAEFFIQYRHKKIIQKKYKKPKEEITTGFALLFSNLVVFALYIFLFFGTTYLYMFYFPTNQFRQIAFGLLIPYTSINILNLPAFLNFMGSDLVGAALIFILAIILDYWARQPIRIKKRKI